MKYPRPIREIHQIELTTNCNLRCHYCPHYPKLPREKEDMTLEVFDVAMELVEHYVKHGTQGELSMTGIGESLLHPHFIAMCVKARRIIGPQRALVITTNGIGFTEEHAKELAKLNAWVFVSLHRPEKATMAVEIANRYGILKGINNSFVTAAFDWAGYQKNWKPYVSAPNIKCDYLAQGWGVILVDGRVTTCCLDADGSGVVGTIWDDPTTLQLKPWESEKGGCATCHMQVP